METNMCLRVEESLKVVLQGQAKIYEISFSHYCRNVLMDHIDDLNDEGFTYEDDIEIEEEEYYDSDLSITRAYERTYAFTCLTTWLFCRHIHPHDSNSKIVLTTFKLKVERVLSGSSFSEELKLEFLKVLNDLNRYLLEPDYTDKQFQFSVPGNQLSFNYYLLMSEIWSLEIPML